MERNFSKFVELVKEIKDGRRENSVSYASHFLLIGSLLAVLSGAVNNNGIYEFFQRHYGERAPKSINTIKEFLKN